MKNLNLIPKITLWVLLALGIVASVLFYVGGSAGSLEVAGDYLDIPRFTDLFLNWNYILLALVLIVTLIAVVFSFVLLYKQNRKRAITSLVVVVCFALLALVCWMLGSPEEVRIIGYEGSDNVGNMARMSDAIMYLTYILFAGLICTICWGAIYTRLKK